MRDFGLKPAAKAYTSGLVAVAGVLSALGYLEPEVFTEDRIGAMVGAVSAGVAAFAATWRVPNS